MGLYVALEVSLDGKLGFAGKTAQGLLASVPPSVDHQIALAGEPLSAVLALEGLDVLPAVTGEPSRREVRLAAQLALHNWHGSLCYLMCFSKGTPNIKHNPQPKICISKQYISKKTNNASIFQGLALKLHFGGSLFPEEGNSAFGPSQLS